MITIISPTKTQKVASTTNSRCDFNTVIKQRILEEIASWSIEEIIERYKVSPKIAKEVERNFQNFEECNLAIKTYQGSSFKNMNLASWSNDTLTYADNHLCILSALYGVVKPLEAIALYRLDFATKIGINLYEIWKPIVTNYFNRINEPILNLASEEYSNMIDFNSLNVPFITVQFIENVDNHFVIKGTYAKIARGKMVEAIMTQKIDNIEDIKSIHFLNYQYNDAISTDDTYIFTR